MHALMLIALIIIPFVFAVCAYPVLSMMVTTVPFPACRIHRPEPHSSHRPCASGSIDPSSTQEEDNIPGLRWTRTGQGKTRRRLHVDVWNPGADLVHLRRCHSGASTSCRTSATLRRSPRHHAAAMSARGALHPFHHRQDVHAAGLHMLKEDAGGHIACLRIVLHPAALGQPRVEHVSSTPTGRLLLPLRIAFHPGLREGQGINNIFVALFMGYPGCVYDTLPMFMQETPPCIALLYVQLAAIFPVLWLLHLRMPDRTGRTTASAAQWQG